MDATNEVSPRIRSLLDRVLDASARLGAGIVEGPPRPAAAPVSIAPTRPPSYLAGRPGRIRIGFVSPGLNVGGAERHMLCLLQWLDPARFQVVGVALYEHSGTQEPMRREWESRGIPIHRGDGAILSLYRACDVAYVWGVPSGRQLLGRRPASCKVVLVSHGICDWTREAMADAAHADAIIVTALESLRTIPETERGRAVLIYNAIDPGRVEPRLSREEQRAAWGITDPSVRICGNVARVSGEKGPYHVAPMIDELWRYGSKEWRFVWVGPGFETDAVRTRADALVPGGCLFPGHQDDVGSAHHAFDWYVMPTIMDAHPLSLCEAMLARKPIIAADVAFVSEYRDLFRVVPKAPSGWHLAQALGADLADPVGTAGRVERAYRFAAEHLTPTRFVREWAGLLESLAPHRRPASTPTADPRSLPMAEKVALLHALSDVQRAAIDTCPRKTTRATCCDPAADFCLDGRGHRGFIRLIDCVTCPRVANLDRSLYRPNQGKST